MLVEKPVSDTIAGAHEMAAAAARRPACRCSSAMCSVTSPCSSGREELLAGGAIGTPVSFHATLGAYETLEFARMRFDADARHRLAFDYAHEWHYIQWLLGPIARCVAACHLGGDLPLRQVPNVIDVLVALASGVTGTVHLDYVERDGGPLAPDRRRPRRARRRPRRRVITTRTPTGELQHEQHVEERDAAFRRQLGHFARRDRRRRSAVTIDEATRALAVAEAVVASCEEQSWQRPTSGDDRADRRVTTLPRQIAVQPPSTARLTPVTYCDGIGGEECHDPLMSSGPAERCSGTRRS